MSTQQRILRFGLGVVLGVAPLAATADVTVLPGSTRITLLNVFSNGTDIQEPAGAARAISVVPPSPLSPSTDLLPASTVVGVYPSRTLTMPPTLPRGFLGAPPTPDPAIAGSARVASMALSGTNTSGTTVNLAFLEPYDVNSTGFVVGQARVSTLGEPPYAFKKVDRLTAVAPLVPGLDDRTVWAESKATAVNSSNTVVGWRKRVGTTEQPVAFYWTQTDGLKDIVIPNALSSRAQSVNDSGLVAGYYDRRVAGGVEHVGFIYDTTTSRRTDFELPTVIVPTPNSWFDEFRNVSVNNLDQVAITRSIPAGSGSVDLAFVWDNGKLTAIRPAGDYEASFAAGISDTEWVVGILRDTRAQPGEALKMDSGFVWVGGEPFDLTALAQPFGWTRIDAAYDVYSILDPTDPLGHRQIGIIVGEGTLNGVSRAFAMQVTMLVPEPQTYAMLGLGLLAVAAVRRRRRAPR